MTVRNILLLVIAASIASGCATTWHHTQITDKEVADRQFDIDDAYCIQASYGSVPMPQVVYNDISPQRSNMALNGSTYDSASGSTTHNTYRGTVTTTPSSGAAFAGGFANGMNLGSAIAAKRARDRIHTACMYAKGWSDQDAPAEQSAESPAPQASTNARPADEIQIYESPKSAWAEDIKEFFHFFTAYLDSEDMYAALDEEVKRIASGDVSASGPQILIAAHDNLVGMGVVPELEEKDENFPIIFYRGAVAGNPVDQSAVALAFFNGFDPLPVDKKRALFWARESAKANNSIGQYTYGFFLFTGQGIEPHKVLGHRFAAKAAANGDSQAAEMLRDMEGSMSNEELRRARAEFSPTTSAD